MSSAQVSELTTQPSLSRPIAAGVEPVLGHDQEGEPAFEHVERVDDGENAVLRAVLLLDEVREDLAVGGRVEEAPLVLQVTHQLA